MNQDIFKKDSISRELIYNKDYYLSVFKKTEGVISATLFILDKFEERNPDKKDILVVKIQKNCTDILELSSKILLCEETAVRTRLLEFAGALVHLQSLLNAAGAANRIAERYTSVLIQEAAIVLRNINDFNKQAETAERRASARESLGFQELQRRDPQKSAVSAAMDSSTPKPVQEERTLKIKEIIRSKGHVNIKDISAEIRDVSEKSIQRDLNSLIENGEVMRVGERRWSIYSLAEAPVLKDTP